MSIPLAAPGRRESLAIAAALAGAAIWLFTHEYVGAGGDGELYTMMALNRASSGAFDTDLFLRYGSQDAFSVFSPIYGWSIAALGATGANIALLLAAHLVWLTGAWMLTHRLARGLAGHGGFLLVCAMPLTYGGFSFLTAGEPYLTSRPFAEGLAMAALAMAMSRRWLAAGTLIALAAAFHPIMALAGFGAGFVILVWRRPALIGLAPLGLIAVLALGLGHVAPFDRALAIVDPAWLAAIQLRTPFVFVSTWTGADWARAACDMAPCFIAALCAQGSRRALFAGTAMVSFLALALSYVGGDLAHDALIIQLQPWRSGWLAAVVQLPALAVIFVRLRRSSLGRLVVLMAAAPSLILAPQFEALLWAPALAMSLGGIVLAVLIRHGRGFRLSRRGVALGSAAIAVLPVLSLILQLALMWRLTTISRQLGSTLPDEPAFLPVRLALLAGGVAALGLARRTIWIALPMLALALVVGASTWDQRTPWERYRLGGQRLAFAHGLPPGAALLWNLNASDVWFLTGHPAYVSGSQAAGLLFSRPAALEWARRRANVAPILPIPSWMAERSAPPCAALLKPVVQTNIEDACARSPGLYGVITDRPVAGALAFTTPATKDSRCVKPGGVGVMRVDRFYYLACRPVR